MTSPFLSPSPKPDNRLYWVLVAWPAIAVALAALLAWDGQWNTPVGDLLLLVWMFYARFAVGVLDRDRLGRAGYDTAGCWPFLAALAPPAYLWRRARVAGQRWTGLALYLALWLIALALPAPERPSHTPDAIVYATDASR